MAASFAAPVLAPADVGNRLGLQFGLVEAVDCFGEGVVVLSPVAPIEASIPVSNSRSVNAMEGYCDPRSLW